MMKRVAKVVRLMNRDKKQTAKHPVHPERMRRRPKEVSAYR